MNKKSVVLITILIVTNTICIMIIGFQNLLIKNLEKNTVSLAPGTSIPDLELIPVKQLSSAESIRIKLIYVFETPCSACNTNLNAWKRLSQYFEDKIEVVGIILDGRSEAERLMNEESINFQLYVPENINSFKERMHIRLNMAQTIIALDEKVMLTRIGNLSFNDIDEIIMFIKEALKGA